MNKFSKIMSKDMCGGTSYFRNPELSSTVGYGEPFAKHGIKIPDVPQGILDIANWIFINKNIGVIQYTKNRDSKVYCHQL